MVRTFFINAKKSKKVNTIIQQNFRKNVIDNFIKNKDIITPLHRLRALLQGISP